MHSNTHSDQPPEPPGPPGRSPRLASLAAASQELAADDLDQLPDAALTQDLVELRQLLDGLEGHWLRALATVDARGAAGAEQGQAAPSTASWLRRRLRLSVAAAHSAVRTARALFGGALPETAAALCAGELSPAHAQAIADGTRELADHLKLEADPVLVDIARRVDPPRLRQAADHLVQVADPEGADRKAARCLERRGVWLSPTWDDLVAIGGLLDPEVGSIVLAALEPLARPADGGDERSGPQRNADALAELARRSLEGGWLPKAGGVRPQLLVTVDLDTLLGHPGGLGGESGWAGPLDREACRRLACDGAVTRVLVRRQPSRVDPGVDPDPGALASPASWDLRHGVGMAQRLRAAAAHLPPVLGARPVSPWRSAEPPGWCSRPSGPPWPCATGAVSSQAVIGRWPGATRIICGTGPMVARPTWPIWPCCAGRIIGRSMRAAGS